MRVIRKLKNLFKAIYHDRRLMISLSKQDFKRRFAGSYFGTLWGFVNPLLTMTVYWLVFQFGFRSGDVGEIPFVLWFMCGIIPWLYISESFASASNAFIEYGYLVKKVVFNINILPMVKILSCLFIHLFFIGLLAIVCIFMGYYPSLYWLQLPYYMLCAIMLLFSLALFFASIMVFFRDLQQIIGVILLIGMWGTPIAWTLSVVPDNMRFLFTLNPIYYIIEGYRDCFVQHVWFWEKSSLMAYFWCLLAILLLIGAVVYDRLKSNFADFI